MNYLLDTNVISETFKVKPNKEVVKFLDSVPISSLYTSVLVFGEIRKGIELLEDSYKKQSILNWLENDLANWFEDRILNINIDVADKWGFIVSGHGMAVPAMYSLIAATAITFNMKLVTRNINDFQYNGLELVNPFIG